ncbi:hypothetical protein [Lysobacter sp. TAB13]|uniref:hypothetical protein n=1 Tax=Lysobacter sp. TAB13 TaxID=3233065 RepID=UPI003F951343
MSPRLSHARTRRGRIARLRVAVPEDEGRYCLHWIDETAAVEDPPRPLYGRVQVRGQDVAGEPARSLAALEAMIALAAPVTLGLIATRDDDDWVHWAVADGGTLAMMPPQRSHSIDQALEGCQRWLPAFLIACAVAVASLWLMIGELSGFIVFWIVLLVISIVATVMTGTMLYEHVATLLENYRAGDAILASEAGLRRARAQASERPAPSEPAYEPDDPDEDEREDIDPFPVRRALPGRGRKRGARRGR